MFAWSENSKPIKLFHKKMCSLYSKQNVPLKKMPNPINTPSFNNFGLPI